MAGGGGARQPAAGLDAGTLHAISAHCLAVRQGWEAAGARTRPSVAGTAVAALIPMVCAGARAGQRGMTAMPMLDRRRLLLSSTAGLAAVSVPGLIRPRRAAAADLAVGFIYVGPKDDYGYNQAHAEGAAAIKSMPGVTIIEEENVPETVDVQKTMESMINLDGASLIFPTSFGYYDPHMLKMCEEVSRRAVPPLRRHVERGEAPEECRFLLRLHRHGPVSQRHRRRPHLEVQEAGLHRRQADPAGADQHQQLHRSALAPSTPPSPPRSSSPATGRCRSRRPRPPTAWSTRAST